MADFEDKLNAILSNPESMAQIMQLAQSIAPQAAAASPPPPEPQATGGFSSTSSTSSPNPFAALGSAIDPKLLTRLLPLIQEYSKGQNSEAAQLLCALRPFLKAERQDKIEQALQIAKLIHLAKIFFKSDEGGWHV